MRSANQPEVPPPGEQFPFRGVRGMQSVLAISLAAMLTGFASMAWVAFAEPAWPLLVPAALVLLAAVYLVFLLVRLPGAYVTVAGDSLRVRFPGAVDAAIPRASVVSAALANHRWWQGLGIRSDLAGTVMLATATGVAAQFELETPLRIWVIPRILPIRARRLRVTVRDPERLVSRFPAPSLPSGD